MQTKQLPQRKPILLMTSQDRSEIYIYGEIGWDVRAEELVNDLRYIDTPEITVYINSLGGNVEDGLSIYNALKRHPAKVTTVCDGMACSAASVIFMAGEERLMNEASLLMIHNAWQYTAGDANELRKQADVLETISNTILQAYMGVTSLSEFELKEMLDAETWIDSTDALTYGFATNVVESNTVGYVAKIKDILGKKCPEATVSVEIDANEIVNKIVEALNEANNDTKKEAIVRETKAIDALLNLFN